jgi:hypothetical protein
MATQKQQRRERSVTARPKSVDDMPRSPRAVERGLSIEPEELGVQFLSDATEQGNFETVRSDAEDLSITEEPPTDDPLTTAALDPNDSIWEATVHAAKQSGDMDALREPSLPQLEDEELEEEAVEVDVTQSRVREASLLDREAAVLGEVEEAEPRTEDSGVRARVPIERKR